MKVVEVTEYDEMASIYQSVEIDRLNQALKQNGITDPELRKAICTEYFSASGQFWDEGWFQYTPWFGIKKLTPQLCFAEKKPRDAWSEGHIGELETLYVPREGFAFADVEGGGHTEGSLYWYFEDLDEDLSEVAQGHGEA